VCGVKIVVRGTWSSADAVKYRMLGADSIELNYAKGFSEESSLTFIEGLPHLRRLKILSHSTLDISPVASCRDLEQLSLDIPRPRKPISLTALKRLADLSVETPAAISDLYEIDGLRRLTIGTYPEVSLEPIGRLNRVNVLCLPGARKLQSLAGVRLLAALVKLEIAGAKALTDIGELAALPGLQRLDISNAVNVKEWSPIGSLRGLRWLALEDVGTINSIEFVGRLTELDSLLIIGTSRIQDGRTAFLGAHPTLRKIRIARSGRNDATAEDIERALRRRPR
jgi:hypothetical protein